MSSDGSGRSDIGLGRVWTSAAVDFEDLRDQIYTPPLGILPPWFLAEDLFDAAMPGLLITGIRDQGSEANCVGHALGGLIDIQFRLQNPAGELSERVSAQMLYQMARFYDAYQRDEDEPGQPGTASGVRTLRSAIKAFYHHGACLTGTGAGAWPDGNAATWPTLEQSKAAEARVLGGYRRVLPILNHYHAAIKETRSILVSAMIHEGWKEPRNGIIEPLAESGEPRADLGVHAFLIIGFTPDGFLVLNSWGERWGGYEIGLHGTPVAARGISLWRYRDWARNIRDGWVLNLGVSGPDVFAVTADLGGAFGTGGARGRASTPYRELRGNFLNLEDGRCVDYGAYATPRDALDDIIASMTARIKAADCTGLVIRVPGILEPLETAFSAAVRERNDLARRGLAYFTCFWCSEFATEVGEILSDICKRCSKRSGGRAEHLDALIEQTARGSGRAFWRDIERNARSAAGPHDTRLDDWWTGSERPATADAGRGVFGLAYRALAAACREAGKPLHLITEGAGVLVLDALIEAMCEAANERDPVRHFPLPQSLSMVFPAIPVPRAKLRVLPVAAAVAARHPGAARIFVPAPDVEKRLTINGYGKSILHLVATSFLDRIDGVPPRMLGSAAELEFNKTAPFNEIFEPVESATPFRIEESTLAADPQLQMKINAIIDDIQKQTQRSKPGDHEMPRISHVELLQRVAAGDLSEDEMARYFVVDDEETEPFSVSLKVNPETVEMPEDNARSAEILNTLNFTSRLARRAAFYTRLATGYSGPRIAAEGDSWFQYPVLLQDIIDCVAREYAVYDTSAAGDLLENIARRREYIASLRESGAHVLLLSAGGNDLCAGGSLATHLEQFAPGLKPADYLRRSYQGVLDAAIAWYERICRDVRGSFPDVTIICHGYDYAVPNHGKWLGKPMESRGITDPALQRAIAGEMVDQFNRSLRRMAEVLPHVVYVDCRGSVAEGGWRDELHPEDPGFKSAADRIITAIKAATGQGAGVRDMAAPAVIAAQPQAISLHVGLNSVSPDHYAGWSGTLRGCENDARAMSEIAEGEGWRPTTLLTAEATREAVTGLIRKAAADLDAGGQFLFSISSHGGQIRDFNGDEGGQRKPDSTLCLYDCQLIDDELYDIWSAFRPGVRILMIADCCHSGSVARLGLPMIDTLNGSFDDIVAAASRGGGELRPRAMPSAVGRAVQEQNEPLYVRIAGQFDHVDERIIMSPQQTPLRSPVLLIGACQDEQSAYDGDNHGVFTQALLDIWDRGKFDRDYHEFHRQIVTKINLANQQPNLLELPPLDPAFAAQRPFTVWGGARRDDVPPASTIVTPAVVPPPAAASEESSATASLLTDEGDEDDSAVAEVSLPRGAGDEAVIARFTEFMQPLGLRHFEPAEFLFLGNSHYAPGSRGFGLNTLPPEESWTSIINTAVLLDELRETLQVPIRILSAYRNSAYNRAIGGATESLHKRFFACDITADGASPTKVADTLTRMRQSGKFRGGIGRYPGFTHVDTRGVNRDWGRNRGGPETGAATLSSDRSTVVELASRLADIREVPRPRGARGTEAAAPDLGAADAAVNGPAVVAFDPSLSPDSRRAVLYSTQFAQRAADAREDPAKDRIAWWSVYVAALSAVGWVTTGSQFRRQSSNNLSASIDGMALQAIADFVVGSKLKALANLLDTLRKAPEGDRRVALLDLYGSESGGGVFQLGAAESDPGGGVSLALGAVQFKNIDNKKRIVFVSWGDQSNDLWIAAEKMTLNVDYYTSVAQAIVEKKISDASKMIMAFKVD